MGSFHARAGASIRTLDSWASLSGATVERLKRSAIGQWPSNQNSVWYSQPRLDVTRRFCRLGKWKRRARQDTQAPATERAGLRYGLPKLHRVTPRLYANLLTEKFPKLFAQPVYCATPLSTLLRRSRPSKFVAQAYHIVDFNKTKAKHEPVGTLGSINSIVSKCHLAVSTEMVICMLFG
jgi:hypothetical protein